MGGNGFTLSVVKKSCALGYYSFGHEVGHSMGLAHNPEETTNTLFLQGHGHLIQPGSGPRGYRTILAYSAQGHRDRKNYYSNPAVLLPETGTATGKVGVSNNAAVLNMNRFRMAGVGDESSACFDGLLISQPPLSASPVPVPVPTTIATTTNNITTTSIATTTTTTNSISITTASTNPSGCLFPQRVPILQTLKTRKNVKKASVCLGICLAHNRCTHFKWRRRTCFLLSVTMTKKGGFVSGPRDCIQSPTSNPLIDCSTSNVVPHLKTIKAQRRIRKASACQQNCQSQQGCSHWKWKKSKKTCFLLAVVMSRKPGFSSGSISCPT